MKTFHKFNFNWASGRSLIRFSLILLICCTFRQTLADCNEPKNLACNNDIYSKISGICNNLHKPNWGAQGDEFLNLREPVNSNDNIKLDELHLNELLDKIIRNFNLKKTSNITAVLPAFGILLVADISNVLLFNSKCNNGLEDCIEYLQDRKFTWNNCTEKDTVINNVSGYLDASYIYEMPFINGRFDVSNDGYLDINKNCRLCNNKTLTGKLAKIFLNEHNRIREVLSYVNPEWNYDRLFHETRKILIAQLQHITFNEFLPNILGNSIINEFLSPEKVQYSIKNHAGTFNEFALASLAAFSLHLNNEQQINNGDFINEQLNNISNVNKLKQLKKSIENSKNFKYKNYLDICKPLLLKPQNITTDNYEIIEKIYGNYENIDLAVGALLELSENNDNLFGPTMSCIIALQLQKLKSSDRFWYENNNSYLSFTLDQMRNIRQTSLSSILCNADDIVEVQSNSFLKSSIYFNSEIPCHFVPKLDLSLWRDSEIQSSDDGLYLNKKMVKNAIKSAKEKILERKKFEYESWLTEGGIDAKSPAGTAASFSKANRNSLILANTSLIYEILSKELLTSLSVENKRRRRQTNNNFIENHFAPTLQTIDFSQFISRELPNDEAECEDLSPSCDAFLTHRSLTGRCNNLQNLDWGKQLTQFSRLLPAQYEDGISVKRQTSVTGLPLPNPRLISTVIHPDISNLHTRYSLMVMQFAQFLDHDLTLTPIHKGFHESIPDCRKCDSPQTVHPECNPFPVPPNDHFFPELNITSGEKLCFPSMRSLPGQQNLGPRQQINQNTHYLDASMIYGQNNCVANKLRGFSGRLNSTIHPVRGKELLPQSDKHPECKSLNGLCFIAGDERASEQPGLTAIHTLFLREHNRIVEGLRGVNPHWNGDQLYENARKIVMGMNQHIVYNEWLPRILSWNAVNLYGLKLLPNGYYNDYNPTCNPGVFNEFAAAAFRIGHSLLRPHIPRLDPNHQPVNPPLLLRDGFFKMDALLRPGIIDEIGRGLVSTPMETLDQFITGEVTNHLFEDRRIPFSGVDLIALNIQRGRDHALPPYNNYRALCNLKRAQNWNDLSREIPPEVIARFKQVYASVDDIDLFPGAMTERPLQGGLVGPTLACIIGIQFRQLRNCDRFWFENGAPGTKFTERQLAEIRKSTLSKVICENLEIPGDMQKAAFDLPSNFLNPRVPCHSMPQIDLNAWRENVDGCEIGGRFLPLGNSTYPSPCTSCVCTPEGAQCASLRVADCSQLQREWNVEAIKADPVCRSQCANFFNG